MTAFHCFTLGDPMSNVLLQAQGMQWHPNPGTWEHCPNKAGYSVKNRDTQPHFRTTQYIYVSRVNVFEISTCYFCFGSLKENPVHGCNFPYMCSSLDPRHSGSDIILAFISKLIHCWHFSRCFLVITTHNLCAILQSCTLWALLWLWMFCSQHRRKPVMSFSFSLLI